MDHDLSESESAFWQFSLRFYGQPGVPALCIALQDDLGIDINLVFYLIFLGINGRRVTAGEVRRINEDVRDWRERIVQPLRAVRRSLKSGVAPVAPDTADRLRHAIQHYELLAERLQQEAMERQFPITSTGVPAPATGAIRENMAAYFGAEGIRQAANLADNPPEAAINRLVTLLMAAFPNAVKP